MLNKEPIAKIGKYSAYAIDGEYIRLNIDPDFTNFGQQFEYPFIPENEFWIDNDDVEEAPFYISRMIYEKGLVDDGYTQDEAEDLADKYERTERAKTDKAIEASDLLAYRNISDLVVLEDLGIHHGISIKLVDGELIRDLIYVGFIEGGHDLVYPFIPDKTIWIDSSVRKNRRKYVIKHEFDERHEMKNGLPYEEAHRIALEREHEYREKYQVQESHLRNGLLSGFSDVLIDKTEKIKTGFIMPKAEELIESVVDSDKLPADIVREMIYGKGFVGFGDRTDFLTEEVGGDVSLPQNPGEGDPALTAQASVEDDNLLISIERPEDEAEYRNLVSALDAAGIDYEIAPTEEEEISIAWPSSEREKISNILMGLGYDLSDEPEETPEETLDYYQP